MIPRLIITSNLKHISKYYCGSQMSRSYELPKRSISNGEVIFHFLCRRLEIPIMELV